MSQFYTSQRAPMMGDGWSGPGARSSPMNTNANQIYDAIKAQVKWVEQQRRVAENGKREQQGLPPLEEKKPSKASKAMKGLKKML